MQRDEAYLLDVLIAAPKALQFLEGITWQEFTQSELHQNAVIRPLEIIGEAARRVSQETRDAHPEIPWEQMIGMRNRLIHEYFRINLSTAWETIQNDLPRLIAQIEPLVPPEDIT
jgi:uncharacterized protein with HEPN domain